MSLHARQASSKLLLIMKQLHSFIDRDFYIFFWTNSFSFMLQGGMQGEMVEEEDSFVQLAVKVLKDSEKS